MEKNQVKHKILLLDCGRKYFTKDWIVTLIQKMADSGFNQLMLGIGNDGLRFVLDDMSVGAYSHEEVKKAVEAGNAAYSKDKKTEADHLTEAEMDEILKAAQENAVEIVPLFNTPGHMYTVITAMAELGIEEPGYSGSIGSVDFDNAAALAFTKGLIQRYVDYFSKKGCKYFTIGADEYANDKYLQYNGMGFGRLLETDSYGKFTAYVNELAEMVLAAGMTPRAFNDGFYYNNDTSLAMNKNIQVCYWTNGWNGYSPAPASTIAAQGHELINTNGAYYYILGKEDKFDTDGPEAAKPFVAVDFPGETIENPVGAMFCIWCDSPDAETQEETAKRAFPILPYLPF